MSDEPIDRWFTSLNTDLAEWLTTNDKNHEIASVLMQSNCSSIADVIEQYETHEKLLKNSSLVVTDTLLAKLWDLFKQSTIKNNLTTMATGLGSLFYKERKTDKAEHLGTVVLSSYTVITRNLCHFDVLTCLDENHVDNAKKDCYFVQFGAVKPKIEETEKEKVEKVEKVENAGPADENKEQASEATKASEETDILMLKMVNYDEKSQLARLIGYTSPDTMKPRFAFAGHMVPSKLATANTKVWCVGSPESFESASSGMRKDLKDRKGNSDNFISITATIVKATGTAMIACIGQEDQNNNNNQITVDMRGFAVVNPAGYFYGVGSQQDNCKVDQNFSFVPMTRFLHKVRAWRRNAGATLDIKFLKKMGLFDKIGR